MTDGFVLASFPGSPGYGQGEPGKFYHMHDVKGRREENTTLLCMGTHGIPPTYFELVIEVITCVATMAQKSLTTAVVNSKVD